MLDWIKTDHRKVETDPIQQPQSDHETPTLLAEDAIAIANMIITLELGRNLNGSLTRCHQSRVRAPIATNQKRLLESPQ